MGCTRSKLEPDDDDDAAAGAAVGTSRSGRRPRGADVSGRKGGFVAAAELLRLPEEPDEGGEAESPETEGTKGDAEGEERRASGLGLGSGLGFVGDRRRGAAEEEEDDLPGSPSFRFYFETTPLTGSGNGDDDSAVSENGKDKPDSAKGKDNSHRQEECAETLKTDEESECKSQKREKGWRFKVLTKKSSDAHNNS